MPSTYPEGMDPVTYLEDGIWGGRGLTASGSILTAAGILLETPAVQNTGLAFIVAGLIMWIPSARALRRHERMVSSGLSELEGLTDTSG